MAMRSSINPTSLTRLINSLGQNWTRLGAFPMVVDTEEKSRKLILILLVHCEDHESPVFHLSAGRTRRLGNGIERSSRKTLCNLRTGIEA